MFFGLLGLSLKGYLISVVILTQVTIAGVTIYLHRYQTHLALKLHPAVSHFFRFWLWMTTGIRTKEWVAIHRKHHANCETVDDPHSPKNWGLKTMLFRGIQIYRAGKTKETVDEYGGGTPNDWIENHVYAHDKLGIGLMLVLDLILFGLPGLCVWIVQMIWIPFWAGGVVNGVGHTFGYRNFEPKDASTNIIPWAIFIGGEELHNNHHTFPSSAKLSVQWWEIDIGWFYIKLLQFFKLAEVKRTRSLLSLKKIKSAIDCDAVKMMMSHRIQIMGEYSRQVIIPTLKNECKKTSKDRHSIPKNIRKLLTCSEYFLDGNKKKIVLDVLHHHSGLNLVYRFKESLQHIWDSNKTSQQELVIALKQWISDAEKSGNFMLERFARSIPYFTVK